MATSMKSPSSGDVAVGRISGTFGLAGELKCDPSKAGRAIFSVGINLRCDANREWRDVRIAAVRAHKGRLLVRFDGVNDCDAAQSFVGATLYAERERIALDPGEFLDADLIGCAVRGIDGVQHGVVEQVEHFPASDMLVVDGHRIPMVDAIVRSVDLSNRLIIVDPPAGLFDE